ncbi:hypothetical protein [Pimelobacter sp. 30-1]|uniref:hypothetical protein n=1 Tax=Pimelobacter sp. 30-1 TaxID=2004991 RepID=UPI001C04B13E|nr:hypothetical protein [Pimelobacter sp. 30-1]
MSVEIVHLVDPEIVYPSDQNVGNLDFWKRMLDWSERTDLKVGHEGLRAISLLCASGPEVPGLGYPDVWTILGKFMSRVVEPRAGAKACEGHLMEIYQPTLGHDDNPKILLADLSAVGPGPTLLATDERCWTGEVDADCQSCVDMGLHKVFSSDSKEYALGVAKIKRSELELLKSLTFADIETGQRDLFPNIKFAKDAWNRIASLGSSPDSSPQAVLQRLSALNDSAVQIWSTLSTNIARQRALASLGVAASPESPNTRRNKKAITKRDFKFDSETIRCEWHVKLEPTTGRIHFEIVDGIVHVGTICDHLPV